VKQYLDLLNQVLCEGEWSDNRTGIRTLSVQGAMAKYDLRNGFPLLTTKKMAWKQIVGELLCFLHGYTDIRKFHEHGVTIWDANLNAPKWVENRVTEHDLGKIYGYQWRNFRGIDQLKYLLHDIHVNPTSRRLIVTAWNPMELDDMCLPPCHVLFKVNIRGEYLNLSFYQRSCDAVLGIPFNIASYALLTHILAKMTGYKPGTLVHFMDDLHIYENHIDAAREQLSREPKALPTVELSTINSLDELDDLKIELLNYTSHPAIKAEMAV
jgi:thymidylate synthase